MWSIEVPEGSTPLGYRYLIEKYGIETIPHHCWSFVSQKWEKKTVHFDDNNLTLHIYPNNFRLTDNVFDHLEFALKHEGINPYILRRTMEKVPKADIEDHVLSRPTGKYSRVLWYFYEKFLDRRLDIPDLKTGNYVSILDPKKYYVGSPQKSPRQRVNDNLLGTVDFSPIVRKTRRLQDFEKKQIGKMTKEVAKRYDPSLIARAMRYLYTKETMASWEIEREKPNKERLTKFVTLLHKADTIGQLSESVLVRLQKEIVDHRFALESYRDFQNYVGEEPGLGQLIVHYIPPKPEDVSFLMNQLILVFQKMSVSKIDPVVCAAVLSFGFDFIHPFEDGNGRIHRFLIHYALAKMGFTPGEIVFPISSVIIRDPRGYDKVLESFSDPLMKLITDYQVNDIGEMTVNQDTLDYYRYIDLTPVAEYLYECVYTTILTDFREELQFLSQYDRIKSQCKKVIDMPDQKIDLFIKCVRQNGGKLSSRKRNSYFKMLNEDEIMQLEDIINQ